ncbi:MAG: O-antigen ligase family protein [Candidatus Omnitrophica bacterium]|nr:O-antigen ligase family protein [Candidatus Omnitrophota bacterium]
MPIKYITRFREFVLYLLLFASTFSNAFVEVCTGITIFFFLVSKALRKDARIPKNPATVFLVMYWGVIILSMVRSGFFPECVQGFGKVMKYTFLFLAVVDLLGDDQKRLMRLFWVLIGVSGFAYINGVFQYIVGFDFMRHHTLDTLDYLRRINAGFVHANDFGAYSIMVLPWAFICFKKSLSMKVRLLLGAVCALGFWCLLHTASRGAMLGLFIGVIVFLIFFRPKFLFAVPILLAVFAVLSPDGVRRITLMFNTEHSTGWERLQLWKGTWAMICQHPILGFGINTYSHYFPQFKPIEYPDLKYVHNCYLQMWSEIGIVGLLVFLLLIGSIILAVVRKLRQKVLVGNVEGLLLLGIVSGYIAFLVHASLDTNLYSLLLQTMFWVVSAYLVSLNKVVTQRLPKE